MENDMSRILKMVEEGKMSSEEANELIRVLNTGEKKSSETKLINKMLRVRVKSGTSDKVNINIPLALVRGVLRMGHGIASSIPQAKEYVDELDVNIIMHAIENNIDGKIIDVEDDNGDTVEVYIE